MKTKDKKAIEKAIKLLQKHVPHSKTIEIRFDGVRVVETQSYVEGTSKDVAEAIAIYYEDDLA